MACLGAWRVLATWSQPGGRAASCHATSRWNGDPGGPWPGAVAGATHEACVTSGDVPECAGRGSAAEAGGVGGALGGDVPGAMERQGDGDNEGPGGISG